MTCIESLLLVARVYAAATGMKLHSVSWKVFQDSSKLDAVVKGADLVTRRYEAAMAWFALNWPDHVAWPDDVRRPEVEPAA